MRFGQKIHIIVYLIVECVNSVKIYNCFCNSCSFSGSSKKGFECVVYKNIFWPFSQNCQGQQGIFTFSVLWVQVTLESKQQLVKKLNEFVQNRHVYTWFIQTFKLTPLHSCSENTRPWWFIGLLGLWAIPFFFSHDISLYTSDILLQFHGYDKTGVPYFTAQVDPVAQNNWAGCQREVT